ncbi:MAG: hypothetical protein P8Y80_02350 [Acidobacteriota bacterium]
MRFGLLMLLMLLMPGCSRKPIEVRHKPELKMLDKWSDPEVADGEVLSQWWESFNDPVLRKLVEKGLRENHSLMLLRPGLKPLLPRPA